jgi:pantoate--beta-alanine ligase
MSSRNQRLDAAALQQATTIYKALQHIKTHRHTRPANNAVQEAEQMLQDAGFAVDYVAVVNTETLQPLQNEKEPAIALIAASINNVRLIDNLRL